MDENKIITLKNKIALYEKLIKSLNKKKQLPTEDLIKKSTISIWKSTLEDNNKENSQTDKTVLNILQNRTNLKINHINKTEDIYTVSLNIDQFEFEILFRIKTENENKYQISNISFEVTDVTQNVTNEIESCLNFARETNNLQLMLFNASIYSKKFTERSKIIRQLQQRSFIETKDSYIFSDGGILMLIKQINSGKIYCKCQWSLHFCRMKFRVAHRFVFENVEIDNFVEEKKSDLKNFNKDDDFESLKEHWIRLFDVINGNDSS